MRGTDSFSVTSNSICTAATVTDYYVFSDFVPFSGTETGNIIGCSDKAEWFCLPHFRMAGE